MNHGRRLGTWTRPQWQRETQALLLLTALLAALILTWEFGSEHALAWAVPVPPPALACENGTVVADPTNNPALVADCSVLLALRDELAGSATLNWSASLPIDDWDGVSVRHHSAILPQRVIDLDLRSSGLGNTITGCLPYWLGPGFLQYGDMARLNLPDCVGVQPATPATPLPIYTLTITAGAGGEVTPSGATYDGAVEVTLTASWNDATHTFAGWSGDCSGSATTCTLEMYADYDVTATFTELSATRCAAPEDADCIRAVYVGAPDDYAQVQDIPAELLLTPNPDGRYLVERGQQVTVVTVAPLPADYTRFYLQQDPLGQPWVVSFLQLVKPVGTTYTFTVSEDEGAATVITFDLHAARPNPLGRPGLKPILGDVVVTTEIRVASCASGTAVANPGINTELVKDCERMIQLRDVLAGSGSLNWDVRTLVTGWSGVTLSGSPLRVTQLDLASVGLTGELTGLLGALDGLSQLRLNDNALTGHIPSKLTTLDNLTHLYLANNSLSGCVPPALNAIANNDLGSLALSECGAPTDISYGEHTLTAGTYEFALVDDGPAVMFDVPAGLILEVVGIVFNDDDGGSTIGLILRNTSEQSWICVDLEAAEECYRKIVSTIQPGTADIAALFDRIAESIWMDDSQ